MTSYMLDTNLFNDALDGKISIEEFRNLHLFVTHIQRDELSATKNAVRAAELCKIIKVIGPAHTSTRSAIWGVSRWDEANYSAADGVFEKMLARLRELDAASGKKPRDPANQPRDVLIAETAIKSSLTLVSGDTNLRSVTIEFGGSAIEISEFRRRSSADEAIE